MEEKRITLSQSNALTESRYNFSKIEKNCIYHIIKKVRHDYIECPNTKTVEEYDNMKLTLPSSILEDITDSTHKKKAHDALVSLRKRDVEMWESDGSWTNVGFINYCKYRAGSDTYKIEISSEIIPHLVELAKQYTSYDLTVAIALKSIYSQRFYELCCQYRNNVEKDGFPGFHKTQEQLRQMFCLEDKYQQNQDFNRKVIKRAHDEIKDMYDENQCDLWFDYMVKGRGKAQSYDFKIYTREQSESQKRTFEEKRKMWNYIYQRMAATYKRDTKFVERTMKALDYNPDLIEPVLVKLQKLEKQFKGADFAKMFRWILKEDFDLQ